MTQSNDPDQIRRDIERTRANLSQDVNALTDEARPSNVARRQVNKVAEGARGLKERIMGSDDEPYGDGRYGYGYDRDVRTSGPSMGDRAQQVGQQAREGMQDARQQASHGLQQAGQAIQGAPDQVKRGTRGNPLAAGLIAFGVGALIGGLAPVSRREQRAVAQLADRAQPLVEQARETAQGVAQEVGENLREPAQQAVQNVKESATDSVDTVKGEGQQHAQNLGDHAKEAKGNVQDH
ncbi:hypothetical protein CGZ93_06510 [Enemella dayhoffiae]|uniref:DUF3618 domain-containing protein n=1 Tax=Enemella dayhoffiae TaxID=2016507 RepID=A0A255H5Y7_9ACTN|nr:DUF3618 domain-containing protein [Enemella dayhoffiae]OYO23108.1 hypothetical protein CGZ93_06510 [Enemella dayhoffiae]